MKLKKPRPLGEVAAKPTERVKTSPLTRYRGSSPRGRALRYVQIYGSEFCVISDMLYCEKVTLIGRGTCGAAWNSLFVPRKLSSSHHDVIIPQKCYFSAEKLGWWYLISRDSTFPSVGETFPCRVMSHPRFGTVAKLL